MSFLRHARCTQLSCFGRDSVVRRETIDSSRAAALRHAPAVSHAPSSPARVGRPVLLDALRHGHSAHQSCYACHIQLLHRELTDTLRPHSLGHTTIAYTNKNESNMTDSCSTSGKSKIKINGTHNNNNNSGDRYQYDSNGAHKHRTSPVACMPPMDRSINPLHTLLMRGGCDPHITSASAYHTALFAILCHRYDMRLTRREMSLLGSAQSAAWDCVHACGIFAAHTACRLNRHDASLRDQGQSISLCEAEMQAHFHLMCTILRMSTKPAASSHVTTGSALHDWPVCTLDSVEAAVQQVHMFTPAVLSGLLTSVHNVHCLGILVRHAIRLAVRGARCHCATRKDAHSCESTTCDNRLDDRTFTTIVLALLANDAFFDTATFDAMHRMLCDCVAACATPHHVWTGSSRTGNKHASPQQADNRNSRSNMKNLCDCSGNVQHANSMACGQKSSRAPSNYVPCCLPGTDGAPNGCNYRNNTNYRKAAASFHHTSTRWTTITRKLGRVYTKNGKGLLLYDLYVCMRAHVPRVEEHIPLSFHVHLIGALLDSGVRGQTYCNDTGRHGRMPRTSTQASRLDDEGTKEHAVHPTRHTFSRPGDCGGGGGVSGRTCTALSAPGDTDDDSHHARHVWRCVKHVALCACRCARHDTEARKAMWVILLKAALTLPHDLDACGRLLEAYNVCLTEGFAVFVDRNAFQRVVRLLSGAILRQSGIPDEVHYAQTVWLVRQFVQLLRAHRGIGAAWRVHAVTIVLGDLWHAFGPPAHALAQEVYTVLQQNDATGPHEDGGGGGGGCAHPACEARTRIRAMLNKFADASSQSGSRAATRVVTTPPKREASSGMC